MRLMPLKFRTISLFRALPAAMLILAIVPVSGQELPRSPQLESTSIDLAQVAQQSAVIVHGTVSGREVKWVGRVIYTFYSLSVWETIQGRALSNTVVAVPGGTLGNVQLAVPEAPRITDGDEIVVFGKRFQGQSTFTPVGNFGGLITTREGPGGVKFAVSATGKAERLDDFLEQVRSLSRR